MPDVIHRKFEERLGSYQHDIFARMAVLAVDISPCFYGFLIEKQLFWPMYKFYLHLTNGL